MPRGAIRWAWVVSLAVHAAGATALLQLARQAPSPDPSLLPVMELALAGGPLGGGGPGAAAQPQPASPPAAAPPPMTPPPAPLARPVTPPPKPTVRKPTPPKPLPSRATPAPSPAAEPPPSPSATASATTGEGAGSGGGAGAGRGPGSGDGTGRGGNGVGSGAATPPSPIARVEPKYPSAARSAGVEGQVVLRAVVDTEGQVQPPVQIVRSIPELDAAAIDALRRWRFRPGRDAEGQAVRVLVEVPIRFQLQ